jgi:putative transposase
VRAGWPATGEPVPAASAGGVTDQPPAAGPAQRAHPSRAAATVGGAARAAVLRPAARAGLGAAVGRGDLPGLALDHVPALRAHGENRDRRRQRTHPATAKPQLLARKPNDVWSWDITKLPGPSRHEFYDLYVTLDIYSRYAPGWLVAPGESAELAEAFIAATIAGVGAAPGVLHADRGSSMTSKPVAQLLVDLGVVRSHSRPHVSDDNPYSEAQFKTLKYCPAFPERFGSIHDARVFCAAFFDAYNHEHRHAALGLHTPASVYYGTAPQIRAHRAIVLDQAYAANPQRFARPPTPPKLPAVAWINQPTPEALIQTR